MHIAIGIHQIGKFYSVRVCTKDVWQLLFGSLYALNIPSDHSNKCEKLRGHHIVTPSLFSFIFFLFPFLSLKVSKVLPFQAEVLNLMEFQNETNSIQKTFFFFFLRYQVFALRGKYASAYIAEICSIFLSSSAVLSPCLLGRKK